MANAITETNSIALAQIMQQYRSQIEATATAEAQRATTSITTRNSLDTSWIQAREAQFTQMIVSGIATTTPNDPGDAGGHTYDFHGMTPTSAARMVQRIDNRRRLTVSAQETTEPMQANSVPLQSISSPIQSVAAPIKPVMPPSHEEIDQKFKPPTPTNNPPANTQTDPPVTTSPQPPNPSTSPTPTQQQPTTPPPPTGGPATSQPPTPDTQPNVSADSPTTTTTIDDNQTPVSNTAAVIPYLLLPQPITPGGSTTPSFQPPTGSQQTSTPLPSQQRTAIDKTVVGQLIFPPESTQSAPTPPQQLDNGVYPDPLSVLAPGAAVPTEPQPGTSSPPDSLLGIINATNGPSTNPVSIPELVLGPTLNPDGTLETPEQATPYYTDDEKSVPDILGLTLAVTSGRAGVIELPGGGVLIKTLTHTNSGWQTDYDVTFANGQEQHWTRQGVQSHWDTTTGEHVTQVPLSDALRQAADDADRTYPYTPGYGDDIPTIADRPLIDGKAIEAQQRQRLLAELHGGADALIQLTTDGNNNLLQASLTDDKGIEHVVTMINDDFAPGKKFEFFRHLDGTITDRDGQQLISIDGKFLHLDANGNVRMPANPAADRPVIGPSGLGAESYYQAEVEDGVGPTGGRPLSPYDVVRRADSDGFSTLTEIPVPWGVNALRLYQTADGGVLFQDLNGAFHWATDPGKEPTTADRLKGLAVDLALLAAGEGAGWVAGRGLAAGYRLISRAITRTEAATETATATRAASNTARSSQATPTPPQGVTQGEVVSQTEITSSIKDGNSANPRPHQQAGAAPQAVNQTAAPGRSTTRPADPGTGHTGQAAVTESTSRGPVPNQSPHIPRTEPAPSHPQGPSSAQSPLVPGGGEDYVARYGSGPFSNQMSENLAAELANADAAGIRPITPTASNFDEIINSGEKIKWAVTTDGELRILPHDIPGYGEVPHSVLTRGDDVLAAGEAEIGGNGAVGYYGLEITPHSGHFQPSLESLDVGRKAFARYGINFY